jgi:hypothetical protein
MKSECQNKESCGEEEITEDWAGNVILLLNGHLVKLNSLGSKKKTKN